MILLFVLMLVLFAIAIPVAWSMVVASIAYMLV